MVKTSVLENFWTPFLPKTKVSGVKRSATVVNFNFRFLLAIGLVSANVVLLMSYIYGVNDFASQGYQITQLQKRISILTDENKIATLKNSEAKSMVNIQNDVLNADFVPAGTPKFLTGSQYAESQGLVSLNSQVPAK